METPQTSFEYRMLTDTLGAFGDGSTAVISPDRGILLLEGWLNALQGDMGTSRIKAELETLRDNLKSGQPDTNAIRHSLLSMASHTTALSGEPVVDPATRTQLINLANALRNFSSQF